MSSERTVSAGVKPRLYDPILTAGAKTEAKIELPWPVEASAADLIERPAGGVIGAGTTVTVPLGPYEIKTIRVVRK